MSFIRSLLFSTVAVAFAGNAFAQAAPSVSRAELPALVKETIMNDPEIIMLALEKLRAKKEEEAKKQAMETLEKNKADIFNNPNVPAIGPENADVTLVQFYDYHCGYCKHFLGELNKILAEEKNLRVIFKDLPILSEDSVTAARASIAVFRLNKDKFFDFHNALMAEKGKFDEARLVQIASKMGIKGDSLKAEMAKPEVTAALDQTRGLAEKLGISGTPGLIIGNEIVPGAIEYDELKKRIADIRATKPAAAVPAPTAAPAPVPAAPAPTAPAPEPAKAQ